MATSFSYYVTVSEEKTWQVTVSVICHTKEREVHHDMMMFIRFCISLNVAFYHNFFPSLCNKSYQDNIFIVFWSNSEKEF